MATQVRKGRNALFIFRRDLRLEDNSGLIRALEESETVYPCFILDPRQLNDNPYRGDFAVQFLEESLEDLNCQLEEKGSRLFVLQGVADQVVAKILKGGVSAGGIDAVYVNEDYTPFSRARDQKTADFCREAGARFVSNEDALLHPPRRVLKDDGKPYTIFTPYFKKALNFTVLAPAQNTARNFAPASHRFPGEKPFPLGLISKNSNAFASGGRAAALKILKRLPRFENYASERDLPAKDGTTGLSAHLKFGTCSAREVYRAVRSALGGGHALLRELHWRDFFTQIAFHFPEVFGLEFNAKYRGLRWQNSEKHFEAWREGKTGFPIVDAGMRQLNATGFMHNRVRMIVSSFLTKDLRIDWRWGEKYFATKLADYDPAVNNGNWQWAASTGCDAQPYFRIFNPRLQQKRFDPEGSYIRKWVPELAKLSAGGYPAPIVDHREESEKTRVMFQSAGRR